MSFRACGGSSSSTREAPAPATTAASFTEELRVVVNEVFTTIDFQETIEGPLSIDLDRADAAAKARLSRDTFAELPPQSAAAPRARMDRLDPLWTEYKAMVAVAG